MSSGETSKVKGRRSKISLVQDSPFDRGRYVRDWRHERQPEVAPHPLRVAVVTGANGFVGSYLVRHLLQRGVAVRAVVRPQADARTLAGLDVDVRRGSVEDPAFLAEVVRGADALFHLAVACPLSVPSVGAMYRVNVGVVRALVKQAWDLALARVVHVSTVETLGPREDGQPPDGSEPFRAWNAANEYVRSRHLGELAALTWAQMGAPVVVVNLAFPVGPEDRRPSPAGRRILTALRGEVPPYPAGRMNFVPVEDVAEGIILAALRGRAGRRYVLGHGHGNLSLEAFLQLVARVSGRPVPAPPPQALPPRKPFLRWPQWGRKRSRPVMSGEVNYAANPARAVDELGMPQSDLETAFAAAVMWFRHAGMI